MLVQQLTESILRAWDRAVAVSGADDLPRSFVNGILPLMPEAAEGLLRALGPSRRYGEAWLLDEQAALLARHAPERFLERVMTDDFPFKRIDRLAAAAASFAPEARGFLREAARSTLVRLTDPTQRATDLLVWRNVEPEAEAARLTAEAMALLPALSLPTLQILLGHRNITFTPDERAAVIARLDAIRDDYNADWLMTRCRLSTPDEGLPFAELALALQHGTRFGYFPAVCQAVQHLGIAPLTRWVERFVDEVTDRRELDVFVARFGAQMPDPLHERVEARMRAIARDLLQRTNSLAVLARRHPHRAEALRIELLPQVMQLLARPGSKDGLNPANYRDYFNLDAARVAVAIHASAAFEGDTRRMIQQQALGMVRGADTSVERHSEFKDLPWDDLGRVLDPSLYEEAAESLVSMRHRALALDALGTLAAALPASARHLLLRGLARLADGAAPEGLDGALYALDAAVRHPAPPLATQPAHDRATTPWSPEDEASLQTFVALVDAGAWLDTDTVNHVVAALTPNAARRAVDTLHAAPPGYRWNTLLTGLAHSPWLAGTAEADALVAAHLASSNRLTFGRHSLAPLAELLARVCLPNDPRWCARLADFFDKTSWDVELFLTCITHFALVLHRLGGPTLCAQIAATIRAPIATAEIACPWSLCTTGSFDA